MREDSGHPRKPSSHVCALRLGGLPYVPHRARSTSLNGLRHMPEAPPDRVLPNHLRGVAGCATVVTVLPPSSVRTVPSAECVMPSPLSADRPAAQPPRRGDVEALISQT